MQAHPTILCPVDFSAASAGSLRYAAAIAEQFDGRVVALTVEDPMLTEAVDLGTGMVWRPEDSEAELEQFVEHTFGGESPILERMDYAVAVGKPAAEILRAARTRPCDLIVISTHGRTGIRKLFFGATTERVLRETTVPVLVTPAHDPGPIHLKDAKRLLGRIVVPVDLSPASLHQTQTGKRLSEALDIPMILVHVIEPLKSPLAAKLHLASVEADRRAVAEDGLNELLATVPMRLHPEALLVWGDPAEELAKVVRDRQAGLVVVGLHGSPMLGPRMGSVTYRILCLTSALVLAIPPATPVRDNEGSASTNMAHS